MKHINCMHRTVATLTICLGALASASAQSFSVGTTATPVSGGYLYEFNLRYDKPGDLQPLTTGIWQWSFAMAPWTPLPAAVESPAGWKYQYKPQTGEFCWYTEGTNGWVAGDFGATILPASGSLAGFRMNIPFPPEENLAYAFDTAGNQDANQATIPSSAYGDLNYNGVFDVQDVVTAVRIAAGLQAADTYTLGRGDVNFDGVLDFRDAIYLARRLAQG